jgi:hypothetical protein
VKLFPVDVAIAIRLSARAPKLLVVAGAGSVK